MRGTWRLRKWTARLRSRAIILAYHRIAEVPMDPQLLCVRPEFFAEQLDHLRRYCHPISLRELMSGRIPRRSVVLTFDDGYQDNFVFAKPLLERYQIPATVFVTSGYVGKDQEFWWDELERLLLDSGQSPAELTLRLNGESYTWSSATLAERSNLYKELHPKLRPLSTKSIDDALSVIRIWKGDKGTARPTHRPMNLTELQQLSSPLIEIGAHTVTHPSLAHQSRDVQIEEIARSRQHLESWLGHPVTGFAYPYGSTNAYSAETVEAVRAAGFSYACANSPGWTRRKNDPFQLPRYVVRDWDGNEFAQRLRRWSNG